MADITGQTGADQCLAKVPLLNRAGDHVDVLPRRCRQVVRSPFHLEGDQGNGQLSENGAIVKARYNRMVPGLNPTSSTTQSLTPISLPAADLISSKSLNT